MKNFLILIIALVFSGFVINLTACASTASTESTGQYVDNSVITTKVKTALLNNSQIPSRNITVTSYKGTVQLSGFVENQQQIDLAGQIASQVTGVTQVKNDLIVR